MLRRCFSVSTMRLAISLGIFGALVVLNLVMVRTLRETERLHATALDIRHIQRLQAAQMTSIATRLIQRERTVQMCTDAPGRFQPDGVRP
jgi:hypothetical protein